MYLILCLLIVLIFCDVGIGPMNFSRECLIGYEF